MTRFNHAQRSGRRKKPKDRGPRPSLGIGGDMDRLVAHRELQALRNPSAYRWRKLRSALNRAGTDEKQNSSEDR